MTVKKIASRENSYTSNKELSQFFIGCLNEYFYRNPDKKAIELEVNHYLTSNSGLAALNLLSGAEVVSAAAMFRVLRLINSDELNEKFLDNPLTFGKITVSEEIDISVNNLK